jgi:hypothetical protein
MERTARRFIDSIAREKSLLQGRSFVLSEDQQRGLAPIHLISLGQNNRMLVS